MKIVDLREISVPLVANIANALVSFSSHTVSLVALVTDVVRDGKPLCGLAFNSIGRFAQGGLLRERFFPRIAGTDPEALLTEDGQTLCPRKLRDAAMANEKPGGHGDRAAAVAAIELAAWDLNAKLRAEPAWRTIARSFGNNAPIDAVPVYAAGGYYHDDNDIAGLMQELQGYRELGYQSYKIKIGGAPLSQDLARLDAACTVAATPGHVAVDANGRFDLTTALTYARALSSYGLRWFEEPGDPLDFALNQALTSEFPDPIATGENLFSTADVRNLLRYAGMRQQRDVFQMDPGLSYGLTEYVEMIELLETNGYLRAQMHPHGGHLINLHVVAGLSLGGCEAYPGVFSPFGGFSPDCSTANGYIQPGMAAGFGLEQKPELAPSIARILA
ncbi:MAG: enolase C-terminal domain-like protein [Pseudomonadales bacterium]